MKDAKLVDLVETPGPNVFFPQATRTGTSKGPAFSLKGGYKKKGKSMSSSFRRWAMYIDRSFHF